MAAGTAPVDADRVAALTSLVGDQSRGVIALALASARELLGMDVAYLSAIGEDEQVYVKVDGTLPVVELHDGISLPVEQTICRRMLLGAAPRAIPDTAGEEAVADLLAVQAQIVGAYIGVPVTFSDGSIFGTFCCMHGGPVDSLSDRDVEFFQVIARIVGDYLERELARAEAEAERQATVARVVHDLRAPLQAIVGYGSLLADAPEPRFAQTIVSEAQRLDSMLTEILDARRAAARVPFDLVAVVRAQVEVFAGQSERHPLRLEAPTQPVTVSGSPERAAAVVANLLSNAIKYSPAGCPVAVAVRADGSVSVADRGLGIPEHQAGAIFTQFFRVESDETRGIPGTGLGLATSRDQIRAHGGDLWFESVAGEGSTFSFRLPLA